MLKQGLYFCQSLNPKYYASSNTTLLYSVLLLLFTFIHYPKGLTDGMLITLMLIALHNKLELQNSIFSTILLFYKHTNKKL